MGISDYYVHHHQQQVLNYCLNYNVKLGNNINNIAYLGLQHKNFLEDEIVKYFPNSQHHYFDIETKHGANYWDINGDWNFSDYDLIVIHRITPFYSNNDFLEKFNKLLNLNKNVIIDFSTYPGDTICIDEFLKFDYVNKLDDNTLGIKKEPFRDFITSNPLDGLPSGDDYFTSKIKYLKTNSPGNFKFDVRNVCYDCDWKPNNVPLELYTKNITQNSLDCMTLHDLNIKPTLTLAEFNYPKFILVAYFHYYNELLKLKGDISIG
jgi:hypothetical protein